MPGVRLCKTIYVSRDKSLPEASCKRTQHCWPTTPNIVGCYMLRPFAHPAQSLKPVKLFSQQLPTFLLFRDRRSVAQQCWIRLHSSSNIVGATHAHYAWFTKTYGLYPSHDALQVPTLLGVVASICTPLPTRMQQLPTLLAQQCWELLRPFARSLSGKWKIIRGIKSWYSLSEKIVFYTVFRTNLRYCYVQKSSRKNKSVLVCIRLFTRNLSKSERHILDWNAFHFLLDLLNELVRGWLAWTLIHWAKQEI